MASSEPYEEESDGLLNSMALKFFSAEKDGLMKDNFPLIILSPKIPTRTGSCHSARFAIHQKTQEENM